MTDFERDLLRFRKRIRLLLVERHALILGAVAAAVAAVLTALSKWWYTLSDPFLLWSVVIFGLTGGAVWGMLKRLTDFSAARATEQRLDLKERLSSAVSLLDRDDKMVLALVEDASGHIERLEPKEVFPHRFTREMAVFFGTLAALFALYYIPTLPAMQSEARRGEVKEMKKAGVELRKLSKETLKTVSPANKELVKRVALNADKLGKDLERARMSKKQAMHAVKSLEKEIKDLQDKLAARNQASKSAKQGLEEMKDTAPGLARKMLERVEEETKNQSTNGGKPDKKLEDLQKRLKDMQSASGNLSKEQIDKMEKQVKDSLKTGNGAQVPPEFASLMSELMKNGDYKRASELMSELSKKLGQDGGKMSDMDRKNLEDQLKALSEALKNTDLNELSKKLREAAEQLSKMDPKEAAKKLAEAKKSMANAKDLAQLGKLSGG
ncbi:MAG: hypothetical protein ABFD64_04330 [Armatimonadota bacterium]